MLKTAICLWTLLICCALSEESFLQFKSKDRVGKVRWNLSFEVVRSTEKDPWKPGKKLILTSDEYDYSASKAPTLHLERSAAADLKSSLEKFLEWSEIAKKKGIREFSKEMGEVALSRSEKAKLVFSATGVGERRLSIAGIYESVRMSESDALAIIGMLQHLDKVDTALSLPQKTTDPREALFK